MKGKTSYRVRDDADTLVLLEPYRQLAGITRLADITYLDYTGIPVFTAIRPRAKSLSTSQGKGVSVDAAKCSALMEAIEVYFAENLSPEIVNQSVYSLNHDNLPYIHPNDLNKAIIYTDDHESRSWMTAKAIFSNQKILVPFAEFSLNSYLSEVLIYSPNTTGLAGGNTYQEALLHSILEIIEREADDSEIEIKPMKHPLLKIISPYFDYQIRYKKNSYAIPSFEVLLKSKNPFDNQILFKGYGCHLNKDIALNRAITEAIQSRVTLIAGSRDDIQNFKYDTSDIHHLPLSQQHDFDKIADDVFDDLEQALHCLYHKIQERDQDLIVFNYYDEDICVLKSKIVSTALIRHV